MTDQDKLRRLIDGARHHKMTEAEQEEQRRSFVYGNVSFENPLVTRRMVDEAAERLKSGPQS